MLKRTIATVILLFVLSSFKHGMTLNDFYNKSEMKSLKFAVETFEEKILVRYETKQISQAYISFLRELGNNEIENDFFLLSSEEDKSSIRKTLLSFFENKTIYSTWCFILDNSIGIGDSYEDEITEVCDSVPAEYSYATINRKGTFLRAMKTIETNKDIKRICFELLESGVQISRRDAKYLVQNLKNEELGEFNNRLFVAVSFYYERIINYNPDVIETLSKNNTLHNTK